MTEILFCRSQEYENNEMFKLDNAYLNRDNTLRPTYELKKHLEKKGFEANTADLSEDFSNAHSFVFFDVPKKPHERNLLKRAEKLQRNNICCLLYEPSATRPDNYDKHNHTTFSKMMTWNDEFVDGKKYFKNNFTIPYKQDEKVLMERQEFHKRKLMCMVSANKYSAHPQQLYTARAEAVKWMEKNHPEEFDLYGQRWNLPVFHSNFLEKMGVNNVAKIIHKFKIQMPNSFYSSYRGPIFSKKEVMREYKFCICYENQKDVQGYISEKIFDAFFAGCIPIYWGASNVEKYIPKDCFVDMREFDSFEEVYSSITQIEEGEFDSRLDSIEKFLNSKASSQFKIDFFISQFEKMVGI